MAINFVPRTLVAGYQWYKIGDVTCYQTSKQARKTELLGTAIAVAAFLAQFSDKVAFIKKPLSLVAMYIAPAATAISMAECAYERIASSDLVSGRAKQAIACAVVYLLLTQGFASAVKGVTRWLVTPSEKKGSNNQDESSTMRHEVEKNEVISQPEDTDKKDAK